MRDLTPAIRSVEINSPVSPAHLPTHPKRPSTRQSAGSRVSSTPRRPQNYSSIVFFSSRRGTTTTNTRERDMGRTDYRDRFRQVLFASLSFLFSVGRRRASMRISRLLCRWRELNEADRRGRGFRLRSASFAICTICVYIFVY